VDPKEIVASGYDAVAERYAAWSVGDRARKRYTDLVLDALPDGARVLDLGCGAGTPTAERLAARFEVTGVDVSRRQVELARRNVPGATFIHADMAALSFPLGSFDAVLAFYSIIHLPREEHAGLLGRLADWLRPGGLFVASMGAGASKGSVEEDWLGAPMYFSHHDSETNKRLVEEAGLRIVRAEEETEDEHGEPVPFLWVVARKEG
jgi:SAM-dependent methyltransferase